jgi:uncharacterized membrane-anchored protein
LIGAILAFLFTVVTHYMNIIRNTNVIVMFLVFFLFCLSVITLAFALTPFFHKPKTAGSVGTIVLQLTGMLFLLQTFLEDKSQAILAPLKIISSLAFTTAIDTVTISFNIVMNIYH